LIACGAEEHENKRTPPFSPLGRFAPVRSVLSARSFVFAKDCFGFDEKAELQEHQYCFSSSLLIACGATSGRTDSQKEHGNRNACAATPRKNGSLRSARHIVSAKTPICTGYCAFAPAEKNMRAGFTHAKSRVFNILHYHS
jgi:hypothetical protein